MVSSMLSSMFPACSSLNFHGFYQVNQRLNETFACPDSACFSGLQLLVCGDCHQLPRVKVRCTALAQLLKVFLF